MYVSLSTLKLLSDLGDAAARFVLRHEDLYSLDGLRFYMPRGAVQNGDNWLR